jgi:hypothetical protein
MVDRWELRDALANRVQEAPETPPADAGGWVEIVSGTRGRPVQVALLSACYRAVWVHWAGSRSVPCLDREGNCPRELHGYPLAWHAYMWCLLPSNPYPALLSLTYQGVTHCPALIATHYERACRGMVLTVSRGKGSATRMQVLQWEDRKVPEPLPSVTDIDDGLWTLWHKNPTLLRVLEAHPELTRRTDWLTTRADCSRR